MSGRFQYRPASGGPERDGTAPTPSFAPPADPSTVPPPTVDVAPAPDLPPSLDDTPVPAWDAPRPVGEPRLAPRLAPRRRGPRSIVLPVVVLLVVVAAGIGVKFALDSSNDDGGSGASFSSGLSGPDYGTWIAQLESVAYADGEAVLDRVLSNVQATVPSASVLQSDDYPTMRPGYWVVYDAGSYSSGMDILNFCESRGIQMPDHCIGRLLLFDTAEDVNAIRCFRQPSGSLTDGCYR